MTITVSLTNPAEHQPSELRALAHFLNVLAADREGEKLPTVTAQTPIVEREPAIIPEAPAVPAPGEVQPGPGGEIPAVPNVPASTPATVEPGETAPDDSETSSDTTLADSEGVMYDARIHSETKSQNKNGTWRQKRGVDPELVKAVLAEQQGAETVPVVGEVPDAPAVPEVPEIPNVPAVPTPTPSVETAASVTVPPAPADSTDAVLPADVIKFVTGNKIEAAKAMEVYAQFGLKNAAGLFSQPELAPVVLEAMQELVG